MNCPCSFCTMKILNFRRMKTVLRSRLESQIPATLTAFKVRVGFWLLLIGAIACFIPWCIGFTVGELSPSDLYSLPILTVGFLGTAVWLRLQPALILLMQTFVLILLATYGLSDYVLVSLQAISQPGVGAAGLSWLSVVLALFFFTYAERIAIKLGLGYVVLYLLVTLISFRSGITYPQFNVMLQFFLANSVLLGLLWLISQFRNSYQTMYEIAHTDALTGIMNRRSMQDQLEQQFSQQRGFGILLIDIDHFKGINDSHGHGIGDQVLRELALLLEGQTRSQEVVSRWGGEEFLVLSSALNAEVAEQVAQRLLEAVRGSHLAGLSVTISIGVAWREDSETLESVIARADTALYVAKANGRDRFELAASKSGLDTRGVPVSVH
jgi:diguanylate cyclase